MDLPRLDPLGAYNFYIILTADDEVRPERLAFAVASGLLLGGFSEVSGLDASIGLYEYNEGGVNDRVHKFTGRASYSNIVLKRGVGLSAGLWEWYQSFVNGEGVAKDGLILLANDLRIPIKIWTFSNGIPVKWTGPTLNAMSSAVAIESLEIAHEKLDMVELSAIPGF